MSPFKIGVALMALEANAPIIPTHIDHAFELLPKGRRFVRPGKVEVTFGEPILPADWKRNGDMAEQYQRYKDLAQLIQSKVQALADRSKNAVEAP
jgi:1-acyl-sn-glycerol-3-phosphate acyltransferase